MNPIAYMVAVTFDNPSVVAEWLAWLRDGHIADVLRGGATTAQIVELDGAEKTFEVRYTFPSRQAFETYERDHAPRLRAEGLQKFPPERGLRYRRSVGMILQ